LSRNETVRENAAVGSLKDASGTEAEALRRLADFTGKRVLEVGCGDGRLTWLYAGDAAYVLGIDPEPEPIEDARRALPAALADSVEFRVAKAEELQVPPPRFDIAFLSWSL
jgi:ubiquinone/menaquinone biosynthesis C-methylase UbiE